MGSRTGSREPGVVTRVDVTLSPARFLPAREPGPGRLEHAINPRDPVREKTAILKSGTNQREEFVVDLNYELGRVHN